MFVVLFGCIIVVEVLIFYVFYKEVEECGFFNGVFIWGILKFFIVCFNFKEYI